MSRHKVLYSLLFCLYTSGIYAQDVRAVDSVRMNWPQQVKFTDNKSRSFSTDKIKFGPESAFEEPPALSLKDYIQAPVTNRILLPSVFPSNPSFVIKRAMILHMATDSAAGANDGYIRIAMDNFYKNLLRGGGLSFPYVPPVEYTLSRFGGGLAVGAGAVLSGCLDPVEIYRNYKRIQRQKRTQEILFQLKDASDFTDDLIAYNDYFKRNPHEWGTKEILKSYPAISHNKNSYKVPVSLSVPSDTLLAGADSLFKPAADNLRLLGDTILLLPLKADTVR